MLAGLYFGGIASRKVTVHLLGQRQGGLPKLRRERNTLAAAGLFVKEYAFRNFAHQHFFQRHGLGAQLDPVSVRLFFAAVLVLHRRGLPASLGILQGNPFRIGPELHHVAGAGHAQPVADHPHSTGDEQAAPAFGLGGVMAAGVLQPPFGGAQILAPLLLQVNQGPLAAAKDEMLQAGHEKILILGGHQESLSQCTPSGRSSETETL